MRLMWLTKKEHRNIRQSVREVVRSSPNSEAITAVIQRPSPIYLQSSAIVEEFVGFLLAFNTIRLVGVGSGESQV